MNEVPLETQLKVFFELDGVPPYFGYQVMTYLKLHYGELVDWSCWSTVPWQLRFPELTPIDSLYGGLGKKICKTKVEAREKKKDSQFENLCICDMELEVLCCDT
jgi:hypothetical protein